VRVSVPGPRVSAQFLPGPDGALATVLFEPVAETARRFAALFVPSAGDEMNKSRRMVTLQARSLARCGGVVALLDPRGTGDSSGEHGGATWEGWRADVEFAWEWLGRRASVPRVLWGMRLGGLLAAELVSSGAIAPAVTLLWQPVISGRIFFGQFLRLAVAQQLTGLANDGADTKSLRALLESGASIEVGGYDLHPALIAGAEAVDLGALVPRSCPVVWRETAIGDPPTLSPAASKIAAQWQDAEVRVDCAAVRGPSFWAAQEIEEAPNLVLSTTAAIRAAFVLAEGDAE
jgi:exosortase A-associated hydrolase 2